MLTTKIKVKLTLANLNNSRIRAALMPIMIPFCRPEYALGHFFPAQSSTCYCFTVGLFFVASSVAWAVRTVFRSTLCQSKQCSANFLSLHFKYFICANRFECKNAIRTNDLADAAHLEQVRGAVHYSTCHNRTKSYELQAIRIPKTKLSAHGEQAFACQKANNASSRTKTNVEIKYK